VYARDETTKFKSMNNCTKWLLDYLTEHGPVIVNQVREQANVMGFERNDLKSARKELNVKTFHQFEGKNETKIWYWFLPGQVNLPL
jgi:hypothetical protein